MRNTNKGWRLIGGKKHYYKSGWEMAYALFLQRRKEAGFIEDWEYEPETFWFEKIKRGVRSYKPDFKLYHSDGSTSWVEVKGYMDQKSRTKIKRFKKYYPAETLEVVGKEFFSLP